MMTHRSKHSIVWMTMTALFMAMNVAMCKFSIPVPGGHLYLCDAVICTAAILFDPLAAFLVGGVGAFLGDFLYYPMPMFVSLVSHGLQAVVISVFAHYVLKKHPVLSSGIGVTLGGILMVLGYTVGRIYVYATPVTPAAALAKLPFEVLQAAIGAVIAMLLCWKGGLYKLYRRLS